MLAKLCDVGLGVTTKCFAAHDGDCAGDNGHAPLLIRPTINKDGLFVISTEFD